MNFEWEKRNGYVSWAWGMELGGGRGLNGMWGQIEETGEVGGGEDGEEEGEGWCEEAEGERR